MCTRWGSLRRYSRGACKKREARSEKREAEQIELGFSLLAIRFQYSLFAFLYLVLPFLRRVVDHLVRGFGWHLLVPVELPRERPAAVGHRAEVRRVEVEFCLRRMAANNRPASVGRFRAKDMATTR